MLTINKIRKDTRIRRVQVVYIKVEPDVQSKEDPHSPEIIIQNLFITTTP
jgi:hypothetical protein